MTKRSFNSANGLIQNATSSLEAIRQEISNRTIDGYITPDQAKVFSTALASAISNLAQSKRAFDEISLRPHSLTLCGKCQ